MDTIKIENKAVKMVAHRGLSGIEKENTCSAFVAACNRATYFAVETDVHRTVDGQFVIFHDDNTARVGLDYLVIEESTFETLRKLQLVDIDGKRGRDYFGYKAIDADGNRSQEATVIIRLVKNKSVSYVDMGGSASYCSAVRLAECGAFIGKQIGGDYYFEPQKTLSRGEFTAMCLNVAGENVLRGVVSTGFTDDGSIPDWQRAYVASAVKDGVVKGREGAVFDAGADISRAEAAVMLDRLLSLADVSCTDTAAVPTWAAQSAANLDACGIASLESVDNSPLTHAEAADMLAAAMTVLDKR